MTRPTLIDTGPLVAFRNTADQHRERVLALAPQIQGRLVTSWPVITEAAYLLRRHPREVQVLLGSVADGTLTVLPIGQSDSALIAGILQKYADQSLSLADASLMHLAEREGIDAVFTVDPKDFAVFRTADGRSLTVLA
ncbi:MAG: type II toxin-antitoxin system VapC family toxin [Lacipirellulaceae bacterium]